MSEKEEDLLKTVSNDIDFMKRYSEAYIGEGLGCNISARKWKSKYGLVSLMIEKGDVVGDGVFVTLETGFLGLASIAKYSEAKPTYIRKPFSIKGTITGRAVEYTLTFRLPSSDVSELPRNTVASVLLSALPQEKEQAITGQMIVNSDCLAIEVKEDSDNRFAYYLMTPE